MLNWADFYSRNDAPKRYKGMVDKRMNTFIQATKVEYVYAETADGSQVKIKKNDLIREKLYYVGINQELDLGINISALLVIKATHITGSISVVESRNNSTAFTLISNPNDIYVYEKEEPGKFCIYKTETYGNIKVKNMTDTPSSLIISML